MNAGMPAGPVDDSAMNDAFARRIARAVAAQGVVIDLTLHRRQITAGTILADRDHPQHAQLCDLLDAIHDLDNGVTP